ncbi:DUF5949 family protein [Streptomyces afghaniensis]|uniref:DUF5949 family protein n=1 Tax=Streptomyces afghaniensis TaxID=66865 RepID=UPI0027D80B68|nr:DUF5949 family protein [Streptomyces afghaniensis]
MTSIAPETQSVHTDDLGSLVVLSRRGTTPKSQFVPPGTWLETVGELGYAYLVFATRPWPEGAEPGDVETLAAFTSDEDVLTSAAHVVLPARSPRS